MTPYFVKRNDKVNGPFTSDQIKNGIKSKTAMVVAIYFLTMLSSLSAQELPTQEDGFYTFKTANGKHTTIAKLAGFMIDGELVPSVGIWKNELKVVLLKKDGAKTRPLPIRIFDKKSRTLLKSLNDSLRKQPANVERVAPIEQPRRFERWLDLRSGFALQPAYVENATIYKEPFGAVMYWGPATLRKGCEIQYRFDFPYAVDKVTTNMGVSVWNRNAKPNFDDAAQVSMEISIDGDHWFTLYSNSSTAGIKDDPSVLKKARGSRVLFIRARLFATKSYNGNRVQYSQFLRSEPDNGERPFLFATKLLSPENDNADQASPELPTSRNIPADSSRDSTVFPGWRQFVVHQRRARSGCIPTGYEMLLRAAKVEGINYERFQDDFDLDINLGRGQTRPQNNFVSVAQRVKEKYPQIVFEQRSFDRGGEKIAFIDRCLADQKPVLVSVAQLRGGQLAGWHIMPVVDMKADSYLLLRIVQADGTPITQWMEKPELARLHDHYEGGKEVAFLQGR